jgi:arylsulfatase A-like enzyme
VILIILDTVRAANMSFMGYARETTPELARLATRGVIFQQAYSTAPWTLPSHASFFTGRYKSQLNADWEIPLDRSEPTVAEIFRDHGYATAGFVANRLYASWDSGLDRGFVHYDDGHITLKQVMLSTTFAQTNTGRMVGYDHSRGAIRQALVGMDLRPGRLPVIDLKPADAVSAEFRRWVSANDDRPFFAFLNFFDAHGPYRSPNDQRFSPKPTPTDLYDAAIFHIDSVLGTLVDYLEAKGTLSNTIVVVTSDHGEDFGEHGLVGHAKSLYRTELHVPLVVIAPGRAPPQLRIDRPVTLRDLPATMLDLAGIADKRLPGVTLRRSWTQTDASGSAVVSEIARLIRMGTVAPATRGAMRSIIDDSTHFILNGDGAEELFAWRTDPGEAVNLANLPRSRPVVASLRDRMKAALETR